MASYDMADAIAADVEEPDGRSRLIPAQIAAPAPSLSSSAQPHHAGSSGTEATCGSAASVSVQPPVSVAAAFAGALALSEAAKAAQSLKRKSIGGGLGGGGTLRSVPPELLPELAKKIVAGETISLAALASAFALEHPGPSVRQVRHSTQLFVPAVVVCGPESVSLATTLWCPRFAGHRGDPARGCERKAQRRRSARVAH